MYLQAHGGVEDVLEQIWVVGKVVFEFVVVLEVFVAEMAGWPEDSFWGGVVLDEMFHERLLGMVDEVAEVFAFLSLAILQALFYGGEDLGQVLALVAGFTFH